MLDRKSPPVYNEDSTFHLLKPEIHEYSTGNKIFFIQGGEQEVIKLELVFTAGRWYETQKGQAHFAAILLSKGTSKQTSYQIADTLDYHGVHLEIQPGLDFTSVTLYGLSKNILAVLDLFIELIASANYPDNELSQAKEIFVQGLRINLEKTSYLAARYFRRSLFGENHPYGIDFELSDVDSIDQSSLIAFRNSFFKNFNGFVSGKISETLRQAISGKLDQLKAVNIPDQTFKRTPSKSNNQHTEKAGSIQASLRVGKIMVNRDHPDYPGILLLNHLLGGFFGSRLMKKIREDKGLTYGIHSSIHALKHDSYLAIGADVNKDNRLITVEEIKKELERLQTESIKNEELRVCRNHFIGSLQSDMSTCFAHADKIKAITLFKLRPDYYQQLVNTMLKMTSEDLKSLAQKYMSPSDFLISTVG
ncbi:MAG: insulinase family protein [Cyclobacteriaceae bacterium]|nr:insulinase family protein [Cyclobacteriaceae bacterium]